jgi:hypothetical protein
LGTIFAVTGLRRTIDDVRLDKVGFAFRLLINFFLAMPDFIAEAATDST